MSTIADDFAVSAVFGTPSEIRGSLEGIGAGQVVAVAFQDVQPNIAKKVAESLSSVASSMIHVLVEQEPRSLERLVELMVPPAPPTPRLLREAAMLARARTAVLGSGDWLTAAQLADVAQLSTRNPSSQPNKWKSTKQIFAINHGGVDYFPGYGLDPATGFRPFKTLAKVVEILAPRKDAWGMAYWFAAENSLLDGRRPQDVLAIDSDRVVAAALDEIQEIAHG